MNIEPGYLVEFHSMTYNRKLITGIILSGGSRVSLRVEARPVKIIDTKQYIALTPAGRYSVYENQITKIITTTGDLKNV